MARCFMSSTRHGRWFVSTSLAVLLFLGCHGAEGTPKTQWDNLDLGVPGPCTQIVNREGYALGYSEKHEQPLWVTYRLTKEEVLSRKSSRLNDFFEDTEIKTGSATIADYMGSGYDRGHLAPAGDMHWSDRTMLQSFAMSNMSPQHPSFNRGVWSRLERAVRRFAYSEGSVFVVTGPVFVDDDDAVTIGPNQVRVPEFFYKVIYDETPPHKMIGFIVPNKASQKHVKTYALTVAEVEEATGLKFFTTLPEAVQKRLKSEVNVGAWSFK